MSPPGLAYLVKKFPRLSETFILNELLGLERAGLRPRIFSRRVPDSEPLHPQLSDLAAEIELMPGIRELDPWSVLFGAAGSGRELMEKVRRVVAEGGEWKHPRFPSLLAEALYLWRRCRVLDIRHVHTHFATDSALVARLLKRLEGPSYSLTLHAKDIYRNDTELALLDGLVGESSFAVTVCDANVEYLQERLSPAAAGKIRRLYNGIDLDRFACVAEPGQRDPLHVLAVARLVEKKGLDVLLHALSHLAHRGSGARLTVIGDGEEGEPLRRLADQLGIAGRVDFLGAADQARVAEYMARATLFCLPCVVGEDGNRDALPTVLLEALAAGLPVVSTPVTGIPEILDGGRAGLLVPERDAEATARAIGQLLGDPMRRRELAVAGRRRAEEIFSIRANATVLAQWLGAALDEAGKAPPPAGASSPPPPVSATEGAQPVVVLVNQDSGVAPDREKGSAVHLAAMAAAFREVGATVLRLDEPDPERLRARLDEMSRDPGVDLVYERYALGRAAALRWARERGLAHVLEANAPLALEQRLHRGKAESAQDRRMDASLFAGTSAVIAVSSQVASYVRGRGADPEKVHVFANGVDTKLFRPRSVGDDLRRKLVPGGCVALGFHGRLRPWHGFDLVAETASRLIGEGLPVHLVIVGTGDFDPLLARRLPAGAVSRVGWVPHDEVPPYVATFDVLPLGYRSNEHGYFSPLKLAEAMASGVVPVAPRVGDLAEIVTHGENGLLYTAGSVEGLTAAIRRLVEDDALRARLAQRARARAAELSWTRIAEFALARVPTRESRVLQGVG